MSRTFTGRHMAAILVAFFGVVVAVNFMMARYASSTFGGIVVENSYVASQEFNRWLDEARAEDRLGWGAVTTWRPDRRLAVAVSGAPPEVTVRAIARHPLGTLPDREMTFERSGPGRFLSRDPLPEGRWALRLTLSGDGKTWRREEVLP